MTTFSPPPVDDYAAPPAEPASRWRRLMRLSRRRKTAIAGGLSVLLIAGLLGASYETAPGGTLWGVEKTVFPGHAQEVALTAVVSDLKAAQDILGSGQQPTSDQLTDARTALNQAKQDLDYLSPSPERDSLQNLYLQLTQQLLQYTPASVQQLPALPDAPASAAPGSAAPVDPPQASDAVLTSAAAPSWGYSDPSDAGDAATVSQQSDYLPPPPDVPDAPVAGWPQPVAAPLTPNLQDLGYYDPSWGQLYGYNPTSWYNYDLSGYNQYGYDFLGFDRWGYDRSGYDRWGYDRTGYNWSGYNWAGYDRGGWDHDGRNDWGQRRGFPTDPHNQDWYNVHHPYQQYYQWKFHNNDPVYQRTQWNQAHGFNPNLYQDWNKNRDWRNPRNRDWAPPATAVSNVKVRASSPVVNLNVSLAQFISNDKAAGVAGPSMKDLADKSARDFTKDLAAQTTPVKTAPATSGERTATPMAKHPIASAPPALTAPVPTAPPSKVAPGFTAPKLAPVPPVTVDKPRKSGTTPGSGPTARLPATMPKASSPRSEVTPPAESKADSPKPAVAPSTDAKDDLPKPAVVPPTDATADSPKPAVVPPTDEKPATSPEPAVEPKPETSSKPDVAPSRDAPAPDESNPAVPATKPSAPQEKPARQEPAQKRAAPEPQESAAPAAKAPVAPAPAPKVPAPAPEAPAPAPKVAPRQAPPVRQAPPPVRQAPPPVRQAPPPAPPRQPAPAPPRAPECSTPKCPT